MEEKINRISWMAGLIGASVTIDFVSTGPAKSIAWETTDLEEFLNMLESRHPNAVRILASEWTEEDVVQLIDDNSMWLPEDEALEKVEPGIEPLVVEARNLVGTVVHLTATFNIDRELHRWTCLDDACSDFIDRFTMCAQEILNEAASATRVEISQQLDASSRRRLDELACVFNSQASIAFNKASKGWSWPMPTPYRKPYTQESLGAFDRCEKENDTHNSLCTSICSKSVDFDESRCKRLAELGVYRENQMRWSQELLPQILEDEVYLCGPNSHMRWDRFMELVGNLLEDPFKKPDYWYATFLRAEGERKNRIIPARKTELERSIPRLALDLANHIAFNKATTKMERRQLAKTLLVATDPLGVKGSVTAMTETLLAQVEKIQSGIMDRK